MSRPCAHKALIGGKPYSCRHENGHKGSCNYGVQSTPYSHGDLEADR